jgi:hypothetical protein
MAIPAASVRLMLKTEAGSPPAFAPKRTR